MWIHVTLKTVCSLAHYTSVNSAHMFVIEMFEPEEER